MEKRSKVRNACLRVKNAFILTEDAVAEIRWFTSTSTSRDELDLLVSYLYTKLR